VSKVVYQRERIREVWEEAIPLLREHYKEIGLYNDKVLFDPAIDQYEVMDDMDMLYILTARDDGKLIGYYSCFIQPNLHYQQTLTSVNDVFYIHPDFRKGFVGIKLLKEAEKHMRALGVDVMSLEFKTYAPLDPLLERLGWDYTARFYSKYIGD